MKKLILSLILFSLSSMASMLPFNNLKIPITNAKSKINKTMFDSLIDQISQEFHQDFVKAGAIEININKQWESEIVNASARSKNSIFTINVHGGLARHSLMDLDSLALVVCHEIGHLIGGAPTWKPFNISSSEGQADYFATLKCFRRVFKNSKYTYTEKDVDKLPWDRCHKQFKSKKDVQLCLRSSKAQIRLAKLLKVLSKDTKDPNFITPDPYVRMFTLFNGYPNVQCRLDTLFAGSLCKNDIYESLDMALYNKGVCSEFKLDTTGIRPKCWYVPRED